MSFPEKADYVNQLDDQKPNGQDPISYGDDHIRLIKTAVHDSFPNVGGPVTADHTELSYVDGVTSPIQTQIDGLDSRVTTNTNNISSNSSAITALDTRVLKNEGDIADNKAAIEAVDKKVDDQTIGDHADVEYNGAPEDGDVLVYDNGKWTAKRVGGAGVTKMIAQPRVVGNFTGDGGMAENTWKGSRTSNGWMTFTVPAGLKFILQHITTSGDGRVYMSGSNGIKIDGVQPYADWYSSGSYIGQYNEGWPVGAQGSGPLIEVQDKIELYVGYLSSGSHDVRISGVFAEDK